MKTIRQLGSMMVRIAIAFSLLFGMGVRSDAQEKTSAQKSAVSKSVAAMAKAKPIRSAEPAAEPPGGPQEGVKVHGHWVIEVRNPDGTLAGKEEFENALVTSPTAGNLLAAVLTRGVTIGRWDVLFFGQPGCAGGCEAREGGVPGGGTVDVTSPTPDIVQLSGSFTMPSGASPTAITVVNSGNFVCPAASPSFCVAVAAFTAKTLSSPVQVQPGQIIQFTVTFSFS